MLAMIGSIALATCGVPEAIKAYETEECTIGYTMLLLWLVGEICLVIYVIQTSQYVLLINYGFNILLVSIMLYYKLRPKEVNDEEPEKELDKPSNTMLH